MLSGPPTRQLEPAKAPRLLPTQRDPTSTPLLKESPDTQARPNDHPAQDDLDRGSQIRSHESKPQIIQSAKP